MKYIKTFEGKEIEMTLEDLYYILFTIEDDSNYYVIVQGANGMSYDLDKLLFNKKSFRFKRYEDDNFLEFKFVVNMKRSINYKKFTELLIELYPIIPRIETYGWKLCGFDINTNSLEKNENVAIYSIQYSFSYHEKEY